MFIQTIGYAPDLDPTTQGVMTEVTNMIPSVKGMKGARTSLTAGYSALAAESRGLTVISKLDGSRRILSGTSTKLYEASSGSWTDRTRAAGGDYALGADSVWSFAQFGDVTLAAAKSDTIQYSSSGAFANIASAPKAKCIDVSQGFVMVADTNDGTYGDQSDRWWCSAYMDYTDWTPSVTTQCVTGRLVDSPGPIYALKALGSGFVAYKQNSIFVASYVGAPAVWNWQQIPGNVGVVSNNAVVNVGHAHVFIGMDDIYFMDGTRPISIGNPIREWFFSNVHTKFLYKVKGTYDRSSGNVYWWYVPRNNSSGTLTHAIVYNVKTQRWGKIQKTIEACCEYISEGVTYEGLGSLYSTYDDLPTTISYDSPYWVAETPVLAYFESDHILYTASSDTTTCSFTSEVIGNEESTSLIQYVRPRFITVPTTGTLELLSDMSFWDNMTPVQTSSLSNGSFDVLSSSRWHQFNVDFTGNVEISGYSIKAAGAGKE